MKIYENFSQLVGKTPLMKLSRFKENKNHLANIFAKLESFNPAGSVKDRVALSMILDAEEKGLLSPGGVIIEPTSGNTGIGLAAVAASKGYKAIFTMPDTMSVERQLLLKAYGAEIVLTKGEKGMAGAVEKAKELAEKFPGSYIPDQFANPSNPEAHFKTTGSEIWDSMDGKIDIFVACVGTGGTVSGIAKYLKSKNKNILVVAVEPEDSPLLSKGKSGPHKIQGIGANFVPENLDRSVIDKIMTVTTEEAFESARTLAAAEGLLVGISSGAALSVASRLASIPENNSKNIIVLLPDSGERYLSTSLFSE